jgi:hypothetical protein
MESLFAVAMIRRGTPDVAELLSLIARSLPGRDRISAIRAKQKEAYPFLWAVYWGFAGGRSVLGFGCGCGFAGCGF